MAKSSKSSKSRHILNVKPSKATEQDWGLASAAAVGLHNLRAAQIPPSKDLREDSWWKVGNQGSTGSCVGWGTAEGVLRWHFVKAGKLKKTENLSVRFIWMAAKESDEFTSRPSTFIEEDGTSLKTALDVARKFGVVTDAVLPFENKPGKPELFLSPVANDPDPVKTFYALAAQRKISSYYNLGLKPADWRAWLANNGPILTCLNVDDAWEDATKTKGRLDRYNAASTYGGHCVAVVGYTPDTFIIRNSWDTSWGDKGYAYVSDAYMKAAFTEAYGVAL